MKKLLLLLNILFAFNAINGATPAVADTVKFICGEMLGRPTTHSIVINMCADTDIEAFIEYGVQKGYYNLRTSVVSYTAERPFNILIDNLDPGTIYYYRVNYRPAGKDLYVTRNEHSFKTAPLAGTQFSFAIEADPHLDYFTDPELLKLTFDNIAAGTPDFMFDLGDTFMSEKLKNPTQDSVNIRHLLLRSYFDRICHSIPLYLVIGNHEGELGWLLDGTANNLAVITSNTRTKYFPNPLPDGFYSGNTHNEPYVGLRHNYYAWEWGSALFVVLDPYWYTTLKPNDYVNNWSWTLGMEQYNWFKSVLQNSNAKYKFVFAHQIVGGAGTDGRGGSEAVPFYEMGGKNSDGTNGFINNRAGWDMPIHDLMRKYKVNVFFHGHDHFYGKQELDGIIYQEVPQPGNPNFKTPGEASAYGYLSGTILPCSGYIKVTVRNEAALVEYIRSYLPAVQNNSRVNGMVSDSYSVLPNSAVSVESNELLPNGFVLYQNYPNPFNPETRIKYSIPPASNGAQRHVLLKIYDLTGREVATLVDKYQGPGFYTVSFNSALYHISSGVCFCTVISGNNAKTIKMLLLK